jgi:uncharacterized protein YjeT (DUF2065 family)
MPVDASTLLDTLLVIAGLILVATGLVMFIYSKTSSQASSVEAFGIKLNVTHPSLILVLAGVGLMLAPRLLPGLPGKADKPEPPIIAQPGPAAPAPSLEASPEKAAAPTPPVAPTAVARAKPEAPRVQPSRAETRRLAAATPTTRKPVAVDRPTVVPTPAATVVPEVPAPSPAAKPARPTLAYAGLGLPSNHSFWSGETRASYTRRVHTNLQQAGRTVLHMEARGLELNPSEFDAWWNESRQHPRSRELCTAPHAPRALLSARAETPVTISSVESAYWPELKLRLFDCANQRFYQQQKTLSPQNDDAWPFSNEFNSEVERFLRTYRGDLTD